MQRKVGPSSEREFRHSHRCRPQRCVHAARPDAAVGMTRTAIHAGFPGETNSVTSKNPARKRSMHVPHRLAVHPNFADIIDSRRNSTRHVSPANSPGGVNCVRYQYESPTQAIRNHIRPDRFPHTMAPDKRHRSTRLVSTVPGTVAVIQNCVENPTCEMTSPPCETLATSCNCQPVPSVNSTGSPGKTFELPHPAVIATNQEQSKVCLPRLETPETSCREIQ